MPLHEARIVADHAVAFRRSAHLTGTLAAQIEADHWQCELNPEMFGSERKELNRAPFNMMAQVGPIFRACVRLHPSLVCLR
jgi:hypothetical protein